MGSHLGTILLVVGFLSAIVGAVFKYMKEIKPATADTPDARPAGASAVGAERSNAVPGGAVDPHARVTERPRKADAESSPATKGKLADLMILATNIVSYAFVGIGLVLSFHGEAKAEKNIEATEKKSEETQKKSTEEEQQKLTGHLDELDKSIANLNKVQKDQDLARARSDLAKIADDLCSNAPLQNDRYFIVSRIARYQADAQLVGQADKLSDWNKDVLVAMQTYADNDAYQQYGEMQKKYCGRDIVSQYHPKVR